MKLTRQVLVRMKFSDHLLARMMAKQRGLTVPALIRRLLAEAHEKARSVRL